MKIIITRYTGAKAADLVAREIIKNKNLVLGLATGGTMIPFYRPLANLIRNKKIDLINVKTFNLDEYIGLSKKHKRSYFYFMKENFFDRVGILMRNVHFLNGKAKNFDLECKNYERSIKESGGIGLQILGIGRDGHIGFNEPGSSFESRTREILLSKTTRKDNARFFGNRVDKVPKKALTMGIRTIIEAKKIILLASGKSKAEIINRALHGSISKEVPASILQKHKNTIFILDKSAASKL